MRRHYVTFLSPGTLMAEQTTREIPSWDPKVAAVLARTILERHEARPFGFYFSTRLVAEPIPDGEGGTLEVVPREVERSGVYFLGGELLTVEQVRRRARSNPKEWSILLWNMVCNDWPVMVENNNSWRSIQPFGEADVLLDQDGNVVYRGDDPKLVAYRSQKIAEHRQQLAEEAKP